MFSPKAETTRFFFIDKDFSQIGALIYSLKFYLLQYVIVLSVLSISSLLSVIMPNSVLSFLGTITVCILGFLYFREQLSFFIMNTTSIFDVLANKNNTFILYNALIIVAGIIGSMLIFSKRDYLY